VFTEPLHSNGRCLESQSLATGLYATIFYSENSKERGQIEELCLYGRITLNLILYNIKCHERRLGFSGSDKLQSRDPMGHEIGPSSFIIVIGNFLNV
jgi:hypothetical protein